ncbi:hypothetical protein [Streptomyces sp. NBC_00035]
MALLSVREGSDVTERWCEGAAGSEAAQGLDREGGDLVVLGR